jgi:hypothetical protein
MGWCLRQFFEGILAVESSVNGKPPGLDHLGQAGALVFFIVRHEHANMGC